MLLNISNAGYSNSHSIIPAILLTLIFSQNSIKFLLFLSINPCLVFLSCFFLTFLSSFNYILSFQIINQCPFTCIPAKTSKNCLQLKKVSPLQNHHLPSTKSSNFPRMKRVPNLKPPTISRKIPKTRQFRHHQRKLRAYMTKNTTI